MKLVEAGACPRNVN